jgi:diadenosine tetraphosphate (Ap4A) HIT family hydrolase
MMKIKDFLGNEWDIDCMGCAISDQSMSVPGGFIHRTQHFYVHQDPLIPLPGFLVIASSRHIQSISEMHESEYDDFTRLIRRSHYAIKEETKTEHLTIVQEESSPHFHLWFFPWTQRIIEQYGQPSLIKIREIMADQKKKSIDEREWKELEKSIEKIKEKLKCSP